MPTIVSTLYPPLIDTFMPAFPYKESAPVTFSFSPYNNIKDIKKIHVSLVNQKTNQSAFKSNSSTLPTDTNLILLNSVWILDIESSSEYFTTDLLKNTCTIKIPTDLLKGDKTNFVTDCYYKVQIRFDSSSSTPKDTSYFINNRQFFSEWSSVCLIKAIPQIQIGMTDFDITYTDIDKNNSKIRKVQPGVVPITGDITCDGETLQKYKIQIINNNTGEILDKTDWVYTSNNIEPNKIYWLADTTNAKADDILDVIIDFVTKNQYSFSKTYQMKISNFDTFEFSPRWTFQSVVLNEFNSLSEQIVTEEDGYVKFKITSEENLPQGFLYVTRASSLDNFKKWELVSCTKNTGTIDKDFIDPTVSSLVKYRYACQYIIKKNGNWSSTKYSVNKNGQAVYIYPNFHDILIMRQNRQLAIRYNAQITSYSKVTNRQVINTLGSKYPKFAENAHINYKKFTLTGLLTAESDFNRKFLNDRDYAKNMEDYDKYMDGQYEVRNDTVSDGELTYETISARSYPNTLAATEHLTPNTLHDLYPKDNWWWEREFREQVINWLNDGEPKLFRSMTEGNIAVMITDISLTPNTQIGRRTYNISMTAYEIGDGNSLEELSSLGIINVPNDYEDYIDGKYINGGIAEEDIDDDDSDDGIITEITVGQIYSKKSVGKEIVTGIGTLAEIPTIDNYNIADFYNLTLYQGALSSRTIVSNSFQLKDLRIQFESPPQWYKVSQSGSIELFKVKEEEGKKNYSYENLFLGYKLQLTLYRGPKRTEGNIVDIFVEEKGYYQVPSNLIVTEVKLFDNAIATLDYKLLYKWTYDESSIPSEAEISEKIVGQISGKWNVQQKIAEEIKSKYEYYNISKNKVDGYDGLLERQYLDTITAFGFDGTSYAVLDIKFLNDRNDLRYVVGRTGVYNLMTDYPIDEVMFLGRRMVRKDNPNYVGYRDNPYILDASAGSYQPLAQDSLHWYDSDIGQETDVLVVVNGNVSTPEINKIVRTWIDSTNMPYETIESIESPVVNTIYGVYKDNDIVLMVYMPDGSWKQVDLKTDEEGHIVIFAEYNKDPIITGKKKFFLEEWEFSLDDSANNNKSNEPLTWYKAFLGNTEVQVFINEINDINHYITNINGNIIIPAIDGYLSTNDIKNPEYNIVYGFYDGVDKNGNSKPKKYKIYYIDQQWYDIEFLEPKQEQTLILAKVPVYGMVNYRGNLVKLSYEQRKIRG